MWRTATEANVAHAVKCNMGIHTAKLTAIVPGGNANGTDKALPSEYYICKKETGVWTNKYLTVSEGDHKSNSHLKQASNKENYSVTEYNNYVPTGVRDASDEYKELYYTKYRPANDRLNKTMIDITYTSFKCDLSMDEQEQIDDHVRDVHGVENGINSMKPVQRIEVDTKIAFTLPSILEIEISGPEKRKTMIHSLYIRSVARNVVNKTNNKSTADLIECRSQEFMTELGKSAPTNFFSRFKMHLYEALEGIDIDADLECY